MGCAHANKPMEKAEQPLMQRNTTCFGSVTKHHRLSSSCHSTTFAVVVSCSRSKYNNNTATTRNRIFFLLLFCCCTAAKLNNHKIIESPVERAVTKAGTTSFMAFAAGADWSLLTADMKRRRTLLRVQSTKNHNSTEKEWVQQPQTVFKGQ